MKRVRIKVGGWLHITLKQMIDENETRFSRLRQSQHSAKNLQLLLTYGLVERQAQARTDGFNIERHYDMLERRYYRSMGVLDEREKLDRILNVNRPWGLYKEYKIPDYWRPKKNNLTRGYTNIKYVPTDAGRRVLQILQDKYDNGENGKLPTLEVPWSQNWDNYFRTHKW